MPGLPCFGSSDRMTKGSWRRHRKRRDSASNRGKVAAMLVSRLVALVAVAGLLVAMAACPVTNSSTPDAGVDADGDALTNLPPLRDVTFAGLQPDEFMGGTINAVTFQVGPYNGSQFIHVQDQLGEG